jgi:hypothetical protein
MASFREIRGPWQECALPGIVHADQGLERISMTRIVPQAFVITTISRAKMHENRVATSPH